MNCFRPCQCARSHARPGIRDRTKPRSVLVAALAIVPLFGRLTVAGYADSVTLPAVADTTIQEAFAANNFGGGNTFTAGGRNQGGRTRAMLQFDIAAYIPKGATINSVSLTVNVNNVNGPGSTFLLHRLTAAWGEGGGSDLGVGNVAVANEASWDDRLGPGTAWTLAGGDYVTIPSASQAVAGLGGYTFSSTGLTADVQFWLDAPENNSGWLMRSEVEDIAGTIRRFAGRLDPAKPPQVQVDYTPASTPPPVPPILTDLALADGFIRFSFIAQSNRTYTVEFRPSLFAGSWSALTNLPAFPSNTTVNFTNTVSSGEGYFRVGTP